MKQWVGLLQKSDLFSALHWHRRHKMCQTSGTWNYIMENKDIRDIPENRSRYVFCLPPASFPSLSCRCLCFPFQSWHYLQLTQPWPFLHLGYPSLKEKGKKNIKHCFCICAIKNLSDDHYFEKECWNWIEGISIHISEEGSFNKMAFIVAYIVFGWAQKRVRHRFYRSLKRQDHPCLSRER